MSPIPLGILAGASGFRPPGDIWTISTPPSNEAGDVYYDRIYERWYLAPRAAGNVWTSVDGNSWTSIGSTSYNAPKFNRTGDFLTLSAPATSSGASSSGYHYFTSATTFASASVVSDKLELGYNSATGFYTTIDSNTVVSSYFRATNITGSWTSVSVSGIVADKSGMFNAGGFAWLVNGSSVTSLPGSGSTVTIAAPASLGRYSYLQEDGIAYLWPFSLTADNQMWTFNGSTFTNVTLPRPSTLTFRIGISIGIIGESILPGEFAANFSSSDSFGFLQARVYTPTFGFRSVFTYFPELTGAAYSPSQNTYIVKSGQDNATGNFRLMKSIG